ncbi:MAG: glutathione S-transferase [Pseudomonadota bacterium]
MIIVHHLENSRSQRVLWLLEELGLAYDVKRYERDKETSLAPAALRDVHPLGKSPVIEDGDRIVAETGAIIEYLVGLEGGAGLVPAEGSDDRLRYTYWLHFAEGSAMPQLLLKLFFSRVKEAKMPFFAKPIARKIADQILSGYVDPNLATQLAYIEAELGSRAWFAGEAFSAADIQMSFPLEGADARGGLDGRFPNIKAFLQRIHARPAYKRALERGGPYSLMR